MPDGRADNPANVTENAAGEALAGRDRVVPLGVNHHGSPPSRGLQLK
jgi:hypothetical protein